jgi:hypothetical protein
VTSAVLLPLRSVAVADSVPVICLGVMGGVKIREDMLYWKKKGNTRSTSLPRPHSTKNKKSGKFELICQNKDPNNNALGNITVIAEFRQVGIVLLDALLVRFGRVFLNPFFELHDWFQL